MKLGKLEKEIKRKEVLTDADVVESENLGKFFFFASRNY